MKADEAMKADKKRVPTVWSIPVGFSLQVYKLTSLEA
jgi:hypothetical protein